MKQLWRHTKQAWLESGISLGKLISAALAAVTMTLISPKIATWTNSIIAVGLIAMVSGLVGASYTTVTTLTAKGAKKITKEVVADDGQEVEETLEKAPATKLTTHQKKIRGLIIYASAFVVVSLLTIGTSWAIAQGVAMKNKNISVIQVEKSHELSPEEIEDISNLAADKVVPGEKTIEKETTLETIVEVDEPQDTEIQLLQKENERLKGRLAELQTMLETTSIDSETQLQQIEDNFTALESQLTELNDRITALENANSIENTKPEFDNIQ